MAHALDFASKFVYDSRREGISVDVCLEPGSRDAVTFAAKIDTGASDCLFERQYAELLGIEVETGESRIFSTAVGIFLAYGHHVRIQVLEHEFDSLVYFFADDAIEKNILGRRGWLDRVRLGVIDYEHTLYLSPYSEA